MPGFCPLASGSKGNSIYLETEKARLLIDAGSSFRELKKRLGQIKVKIEDIDAVLVSHEHMDHIEALKGFYAAKTPVFCNSETAKGIYKSLHILPRFKIFSSGEPFAFHDLIIHPFSVQHDTLDPVGFSIYYRDLKLGFCTDLGIATTSIVKYLENSDYLYLEANHDSNMLQASNRPEILKKRISSRQGHLSNQAVFQLLLKILHKDLKHVFLAHLSEECNSEKLLETQLEKFLKENQSRAGFSLALQRKISDFIKF